jgi:hypothetical protein
MEATKQTHRTPEELKEYLQKLRSDFLKDFLDERYLREYLARQYNVRDLSNVKVEFMKKDFKELVSTSLDQAAVEALVTKIQAVGNPDEQEEREQIFHDEIEKVVMQYLF